MGMEMNTNYRINEEGKKITLKLKRRTLCNPEMEIFKEILQPVLLKKPSRLFIDLSAIHHLDSAAIGYLIEMGRELKLNGSSLVLIKLQPKIRSLLEHLREGSFYIKDTVESTGRTR